MAKRIIPQKSIGRKRLIALAEHVEERMGDPKWRKFFNMGDWVHDIYKPGEIRKYQRAHGKLKDGSVAIVNGECGTSACLLGHGVNVPMLRKAGLKAVFSDQSYNDDEMFEGRLIYEPVKGDGDRPYTELFGISADRLEQMFLFKGEDESMSSVTPEEAVANMRLVIARIDTHEGWRF